MTDRRFSFGPWTTSLDSGSRLELNAFWKRRMRSLAELPRNSRRLGRCVLAGSLVAGALLAATPLVNFSPALAAAENDQIAAKQKAERAFVGKFSNGVEVELVGLSMNPSTTEPFWRPDGTLLDERPYARLGARMESADSTAREVCYRVRGVGDPNISIDWMTDPHYNGCGDGACRDAAGQPIAGLTAHAFSLPGKLARCNMRFTMTEPDSRWTNFHKDQAGYVGAFAATPPGGERSGVVFAKPQADRNGTTIVMGYKLPQATDVRLVITDKQGADHIGLSEGGAGMLGFTQRTLHFPILKPDQLKTYTVQTRTRRSETIVFRNVSLLPGEETDIEIAPLAGGQAPQAEPAPKPDNQTEGAPADAPPDEAADEGANADRRPPLTNAQRAAIAIGKTLAEKHGYALQPGEAVKRVAPPFPRERTVLCRLEHPGISNPPDMLPFRWTNNSLSQAGVGQNDLMDLLEMFAGVYPQRVADPQKLLNANLTGDWVVRPDAPREQMLAEFQAIANGELSLGVRLRMADVKRRVYVARGSFSFKPLPGQPPASREIHVFGDNLEPIGAGGGGTGDYEELLYWVGRWIGYTIVSEVQDIPQSKLSWTLHQPYNHKPEQYERAHDPERTLANLSRQTGLTFTQEIRRIEVLFVSRDVAGARADAIDSTEQSP